MSRLLSGWIAASGLALLALAPLQAQSARTWSAPKTPWGDPSLEGTWTNETITPFERPAALADKPFLTRTGGRATSSARGDAARAGGRLVGAR